MACAINIKASSMATTNNSCLLSLPPLFATSKLKTKSFSLKPINYPHLSCTYSSLSLKKKATLFKTSFSVISAQEEEEEEEEENSLILDGQDFDFDGQENLEVNAEEVEESDEVEEAEEEEFQEPPDDARLFVGNLPYDVDSEGLARLFEQAGVVEIAEVIYNRDTDQSRGFGFVTMSTVEEAEKAVEMYNRYDVKGRLLTVNKASPRGSQPERPPRTFEQSYKIYVSNIPWGIDDARLEQLFSEHGKVVRAQVVYDRESGQSRGFGFVTMASEAEMSDAIANLDGQSLDGRAIRVSVAEVRSRRSTF